MEQKLYQLPEGWEWHSLGDVATLINGRAYKKPELLESGPVPVLRVGNFFSNRSWYYSDLELPPEKYCEEGDLLYAWSASFGPKIWEGPKAIFHYHIWKIVTSDVIDKFYLYHLLELDTADIKASGNGVAMAHATKGGMEKRKIPVPPLSEQKRIVAKLDTLFTRIDSAIEQLQQTLELSQALFASALDEVFNADAHDNVVPIKDVSLKIQYGHTTKAAAQGNAQFLRITDIQNSSVNWETVPYVSVSEKDLAKYELHKDDIVFARSGATSGKSFLIEEAPKNAIFASYLIRLVPDKSIILPQFVYLYFQSPEYWGQVIENVSGAAQPNINGTKLGAFKIPLPSLEEQESVVAHFSALSENTRALEEATQEKLDHLKALKASLLDAAFRGQL